MNIKHIGIFGRRNAGKSSLINLLLGQDFAIVSPQPGTTTDPVKKRMEIPDLGPVQLIDTAGIDDEGDVGEMRVGKSLKLVEEVDLALLLFTGNYFGKEEKELLARFKEFDVPVVVVHNQSDIVPLDCGVAGDLNNMYNCDVVEFSCNMVDPQAQKEAVDMLVSFMIKGLLTSSDAERTIMQDLVEPGDNIVLVCPIDSEAPAGRMILPQVMAIRDILDQGGVATVLQPEQLQGYLKSVLPGGALPKMVVTDSQVFKAVSQMVPEGIPLTSFSILMARAKGPFEEYLKGSAAIDTLKDGDKVLVLESCTHHTSCEDIGRVKIPAMLQKKSGAKLSFTFVSGLDELPSAEELSTYALALQCGGCMVTRRQLINRIRRVIAAGVPVTNYGMCIAHVNHILGNVVFLYK
ncbi:MAG: [FeFe] hydrogenase H-cluster maturation GTPase HydF [Bacteroidales bacterium]|nr:[FeFe] hydrogenase H-cluster maturation GTPase HydF [Bacteroidales bacterium]